MYILILWNSLELIQYSIENITYGITIWIIY